MGNPFPGLPFSLFLMLLHGGVFWYGAGLLLQKNEPEVRLEKVNMGVC